MKQWNTLSKLSSLSGVFRATLAMTAIAGMSAAPALGQTAPPLSAAVSRDGQASGRILRTNAKPFHRVIIIMDPTISFQPFLSEARKIRLELYQYGCGHIAGHRSVRGQSRQPDPGSHVYSRHPLPERGEKEFDAAFATLDARQLADQEGTGTDWVGALQRAAAYIRLSPVPAETHLLCYGDLIADPWKDPRTHRVLARFPRVEGWDFTPLAGLTSATFLYADDSVRLKLMKNASFTTLAPAILTPTEARAQKGSIQPPRRFRSAQTGGSDGAPWHFYGAACLAVAALAYLALHPQGNRTRRRA